MSARELQMVNHHCTRASRIPNMSQLPGEWWPSKHQDAPNGHRVCLGGATMSG